MPDRSILTKARIPIDSIAGIFFHTSMKIPVLFIVTSLILTFSLQGETVKDREGAVRADAKKMEGTDRWLYNDLETAFAEAEKSGKPIMVVLRCVPCLACMGIDTELLMESGTLSSLMDEFVRVRVINANSLDLSLFQFDYDLSFSVIFLNADKTIYGRFGSWEHQKDSQNRATSGLRQAMERSLALHRNLERYQESLEGKKGDPMPYRTPVDMPQLGDRYEKELDWSGQVVKSCVHCHQIGDAIRLSYRDEGKVLPIEWIAPYPAPETIGLTFKEDPVMEIDRVEAGSPAAEAGLQSGDQIQFLEGQPLISVADVSWVLHHASSTGSLDVQFSRGGATSEATISLPAGWREKSDLSRRVGTWPMRAMAFGGMKLQDLDDDQRRRLNLSLDALALEVPHLGQYNKHGAAKRQGFQKGDIIVEIDGSSQRMTESALLARHLLTRKPGEKVPTVVLRNGKRVELKMPIQ